MKCSLSAGAIKIRSANGLRDLNIDLVAEHGVWIQEKQGIWELIEPLANYWKEEIHPILERYMDRTPGSHIEEKDYSLVWHFRNSDSELAAIRSRELKEDILHFTTNLGISVLEGNKVIEIKNAGINKGHAALRLDRTTSITILSLPLVMTVPMRICSKYVPNTPTQ